MCTEHSIMSSHSLYALQLVFSFILSSFCSHQTLWPHLLRYRKINQLSHWKVENYVTFIPFIHHTVVRQNVCEFHDIHILYYLASFISVDLYRKLLFGRQEWQIIYGFSSNIHSCMVFVSCSLLPMCLNVWYVIFSKKTKKDIYLISMFVWRISPQNYPKNLKYTSCFTLDIHKYLTILNNYL